MHEIFSAERAIINLRLQCFLNFFRNIFDSKAQVKACFEPYDRKLFPSKPNNEIVLFILPTVSHLFSKIGSNFVAGCFTLFLLESQT